MEESRKENIRLFFFGIIIGIIGNFFASAWVEMVKSSGMVERTEWDILILVSSVFFFWSLLIVGRKLGFSKRELRALKSTLAGIVILVVVFWLLEFYIVPTFFHGTPFGINGDLQLTVGGTLVEAIISFLATLFGVLIGIPVALYLDRRTRISHDRERAKGVLLALKEEIHRDVELLRQIQRELKPNSIIYYNIDMNTWKKTTSLEDFELIINSALLRHIYRIYYEYEHLNRKIDAQFNMHYSVVRAMKDYLQERQTIVEAILGHASGLEKESEQLINEIDTELARL
jgi:hypothetical protein